MARHMTIIQGHPDPQRTHFGHALAAAYANGANEAGHEVRSIEVASLEFPLLRTKEEFETSVPPESIRQAQDAIRWAHHVVILYPLWLGTMPALLKGFFEQVFRPGFAADQSKSDRMPKGLLRGRSVRIVITMGMPAFFYRWYYRAHSLKSLERNLLGYAGLGPIKETLIGFVESSNPAKRQQWLEKMRALGREGR